MAEKPLTDSINALTTYINEVTGGEDTNLSGAVATLANGYGNAIFSSEKIKQQLEQEGFLFSEFTFSQVLTGYMSVPHNLGRVPTDVVALKKQLSNTNGYQIGVCENSNFGKDNDHNRTSVATNVNTKNNKIYAKILEKNTYFFTVSGWGFCKDATAENVQIRNQTGTYTQPALGDWYLGVR